MTALEAHGVASPEILVIDDSEISPLVDKNVYELTTKHVKEDVHAPPLSFFKFPLTRTALK